MRDHREPLAELEGIVLRSAAALGGGAADPFDEPAARRVQVQHARPAARAAKAVPRARRRGDEAAGAEDDVHVLVEKGPALAIRDSAKIETRAVSLKNKEGALATVRGDRSSAIDLSGTDTTANAIAISAEVPASAIIKP